MIEKNSENSVKSDPSEHLEENGVEISNFKLLYRKTPNPERDKSSGVSSDEETTSSSLVPIPDALKQIRNKSKWTLSETGEHYGKETAYGCGMNEKSPGNIINSLEELRKKYTLKNERSVALKMDSANMMLDDILNSANLIRTSNESLQSKSFKEQEFIPNCLAENESSLTDSSAPHQQLCAHIFDHGHVPVPVDFLTTQCHKHCNAVQPFHNSSTSIEKDASASKGDLALIQRKKSLIEKFQDLQIRCRIQSIYKILQKTKNPFAKNRKDAESIGMQQGIPGAGYEKNVLIENETLGYNCEHNKCLLNHIQKKMILDLTEPSEISCFEFKNSERDDWQCTCIKKKECNCPEVIPKCACAERTSKVHNITFEKSKSNLAHSARTEFNQATRPVSPRQTNKEDESSLFLQNENEDRKKRTDSQCNNLKGRRKNSSAEKELIERTDIYYFDHGNSAYYKTTDDHPKRYTEGLVERTDEYATKFWAEIFGTIEIGVAFLISFILQLYRFLFTSIIRSLLVGLIQISSDYFFKPLLTILFNGIIQPCLILAYNIATSIRDLCLPISQTFGFYAKELANVFRSCRLIEINHNQQSHCYCKNKV